MVQSPGYLGGETFAVRQFIQLQSPTDLLLRFLRKFTHGKSRVQHLLPLTRMYLTCDLPNVGSSARHSSRYTRRIGFSPNARRIASHCFPRFSIQLAQPHAFAHLVAL